VTATQGPTQYADRHGDVWEQEPAGCWHMLATTAEAGPCETPCRSDLDFVREIAGPLEEWAPVVAPAAEPSLGRLGELEVIAGILEHVRLELESATERFGPFASPHEGYAVLLEEVDELWAEIKADKLPGARERMRREALQVAAMAARFLLDVPAEEAQR
jgi:hypothetical protein